MNPPSDEKLRRIEQMLGFTTGELLTQAHLQRTPRDVRAVLHRLMADAEGEGRRHGEGEGQGDKETGRQGDRKERADVECAGKTSPPSSPDFSASPRPRVPASSPSEDSHYLSGVLQEMANRSPLNHLAANAVPVINRVSAGYPRDFSDLAYPQRTADEYLSCPDVTDRQAFAARVHGDSMTPKYRPGDIVVFSPALSARDGDDCFIRFTDGQTTFKRVFFESGENNHPVLRLQPRNERHRAQVVPSEQVAGLHKAVYRYQKVDEE